ncbi:MAG: histidinol-phosphatase HisJ [Promethearchaeota archaeon]
MQYWDYHTHNSLCNHAIGTINDYIASAIKKDLAEIGISDHFPMDLLPKHFHIYAMPLNEFPNYINEIKRLQVKYISQIKVKIASEVDFFPMAFNSYKRIIKPYLDDFDYIIGSVHAVPWQGIDAIPIDEVQAIPMIKELGVDRVYLKYYDTLMKMIKTNFYQIVGHFDLPKKYGLFPQDSDKIWQKVLQVVDQIEKSGMVVEINTSGLYKKAKQTYPSPNIIKELIQRRIPITLGSDAHSPQYVGFKFKEILVKVKKWGLSSLCQFSNYENNLIPLD